MGNQLNLCNGNNKDPHNQEIIHEPDAMVTSYRSGDKRQYFDQNEGSYVSFILIKFLVRI